MILTELWRLGCKSGMLCFDTCILNLLVPKMGVFLLEDTLEVGDTLVLRRMNHRARESDVEEMERTRESLEDTN